VVDVEHDVGRLLTAVPAAEAGSREHGEPERVTDRLPLRGHWTQNGRSESDDAPAAAPTGCAARARAAAAGELGLAGLTRSCGFAESVTIFGQPSTRSTVAMASRPMSCARLSLPVVRRLQLDPDPERPLLTAA
jgi:hypothetical protein